MNATATKVTAVDLDAGPAPRLSPLAPLDEPMGWRWSWVTAQLDEEPFYDFAAVSR